MDLHSFLQAVLLGIVEGITEFLPISSTGHLLLMDELLGFQGPPGKVFEIVIQLGAILSVVWIYRDLLWRTVLGLGHDRAAQALTRNVIVAFIPAVVIGVIAHDFIKNVLMTPIVVAVSLIVGGIAIIVIERARRTPHIHRPEEMSTGTAFVIGLAQCIAMIPGVSRSGATIMGGLLLKVDRRAATDFSFFLAIPTMFGATLYDLYKNRHEIDLGGAEIIAVGFVVSFIVALIAVRWMLRYIKSHDFTAFAIYRIIIGAIALVWLLARA